MNGTQHQQIGSNAVTYLPPEAAEYWKPVQDILREASLFPDIFWPGEKSNKHFLEKYPDWRDYILIPVGKEKISCHSAFDTLRLEETYPTVLNFLLKSALDLMQKGNKNCAAKFVGVLSHIIGDTGQAAHVCDPKNLVPLFQRENEVYLLHTFIENNPAVFYPEHAYHAVSLGNTLTEVQWQLFCKLQSLKRHSQYTIVPIMCATLQDDWNTAAQYASATVGECTDLFSDLLYSLYLLKTKEHVLSAPIKLLDMEFSEYHIDGMFNFMPQKNFIPGKNAKTPIALDIGEGIQNGIALLPDMFAGSRKERIAYVEYKIPEKIFETLTFSCGLNRLAPSNETSARFEIFADGKKIWQSPDLELHSKPCHAEVKLGNATTLRLQIKDTREDAFDTKFFYPCYIEPQLNRYQA